MKMKYLCLLAVLFTSSLCNVHAASPFSEGRWVKLSVDSAGIYQVTHSRLRDLGFSNPECVKVYGYPASELAGHDLAAVPSGLPEIASAHAAGKLLFYAEAGVKLSYERPSAENHFRVLDRERNPASHQGCYFLSDATLQGDGQSVVTVSGTASSAASPRTAHVSVTFMEDEISAPAGGGTFFVGHEIKDGVSPDYRATIVDAASDTVTFQVVAAIRNLKSSFNNYLTLEFPDGGLTPEGDNCSMSSVRVQSVFERFRPSCNVVRAILSDDDVNATYRFCAIPSTPAKGADFTFAAVDWMAVAYDRRNDMTAASALDMVLYDVLAGESVALTGATSGTMVWNVADLHRVESYPLSADGLFSLPAQSDVVHLLAFDPARPQREPHIRPEPVSDRGLLTMSCPDAVILTTSCFAGSAASLAELHREYQGLDVAVVDQQAVFDEFSSGTPHVMAVRRFLRHLSDLEPGKLRGLIVYGAGTIYQASRLTADGIFVITAENEDSGDGSSMSSTSQDRYGNFDMTRSFATDTYFGRLDDFEPDDVFGSPFFRVLASPLSIMVGRIPVTSIAQADDYNEKVRRYLENPPMVAAPNNAMFMSGFAKRTEDMHMADAERMASVGAGMVGPALTLHRAAHNMFGTSAADTRAISTLIASTLRRGVGFMTYFGHGNSVGLTGVWSLTDVNKTDYTHSLPMAMFGSCDVAAFDINLNSLSTALLLRPTGGVIGLVASGREVYQALNAEFGADFAEAYFSMADGEALGVAFVESHNRQMAAHDKQRMCNALAYNFFGDPMLPYYGVSRQIDLTSVNGGRPIIPGGINTFEGVVKRADGSVDTGFDGTVKVAVFDHPYTAVNRAPAVSTGARPSTIDEIVLDQEQITELVGQASAGRFTVCGHVPSPQREGTDCRVTAYAFSHDLKTRASGALTGVTVDFDTDPVVGDSPAPEIVSFGIADFDVTSNAVYESSDAARVIARINAPAGLAVDGNFCAAVRLLRDGALCAEASSGIVASEPGVYLFEMNVEIPSDGRHRFELIVTDALQRQASAAFDFRSQVPLDCSLAVDCEEDAFRFTIGGAAALENCTVTVEDFRGAFVCRLTADADGMIVWNLRDADGKRVAPGHYRAYARCFSGNSCWSSPHIDMVVR